MNTLKKLQNYIEKNSVSQAEIARSLGYSPAVINQYLKGNYKGDKESLTRKIEQYISSSKKPDTDVEIMQTGNVASVSLIINQCILMKRMGMISGASGSGKTTAIKHVISTLPQSILIEVKPTTTTKSLFISLAEKLKINPANLSINSLISDIEDALHKRDAVIVIDEAEYLTKKSLESIRRIWDMTKTPIIYSGTEKIIPTLYTCPQLRGRININWNMEKLSSEDTVKHCQSYGININIAQNIHRHARGNYRDVSNMIDTGLMFAGGNEYNEEILEATKGAVFI